MHTANRQPEPLAYTIAQAMAATGLGRTKIYELLAEGRLRSVRIGRRRLVTAESLRELLTPVSAWPGQPAGAGQATL